MRYETVTPPADLIDGDQTYTIAQLIKRLRQMEKTYGKHALITFDGGYYNVCVSVEPTRKQRK